MSTIGEVAAEDDLAEGIGRYARGALISTRRTQKPLFHGSATSLYSRPHSLRASASSSPGFNVFLAACRTRSTYTVFPLTVNNIRYQP